MKFIIDLFKSALFYSFHCYRPWHSDLSLLLLETGRLFDRHMLVGGFICCWFGWRFIRFYPYNEIIEPVTFRYFGVLAIRGSRQWVTVGHVRGTSVGRAHAINCNHGLFYKRYPLF